MNASTLIQHHITQHDFSKTTERIYKKTAEKYGDLDMTHASYKKIISKVEASSTNPNTQAAMLNNIAILVTKDRPDLLKRLIAYREDLARTIANHRKNSLKQLVGTLPTYEELIGELESLTGVKYIVNYCLIHLGFRNADLNLQYIGKLTDIPSGEGINYIHLNRKTHEVTMIINQYKTHGTYGTKEIKHNDARLSKELKEMNLVDGDFLLSLKDGTVPSHSTVGDKVMALSIGKLGETKIVKVVVKHYLDNKSYEDLENISKTRGTSIATLISSYNLYNTN